MTGATKWFLVMCIAIIVFIGCVATLTQVKDPEQSSHADNDEPIDDRIVITDAVLDIWKYTGDWRLTVTATKPLPDMTKLYCEIAGTTYVWGIVSEWVPVGEGGYTSLDTGMPTSYDDAVWDSVYFSPGQPDNYKAWPLRPTVNLH